MTTALTPPRGPRPARALDDAYAVPRPGAPTDLWLAGNEGRAAAPAPALPAAALSRYPGAGALEGALASAHGVDAGQVLVTAGADDALLRCALAYCCEGRALVLPSPTFEMIPRYVALAGGVVRAVKWAEGAFPTTTVIDAAGADAAAIAVVSPNNPTGAVATARDLARLSEACPDALLVVDCAYAEFADEDLTAAALELPNAVVLRTFSKAHGAAGMRVGYAAGPAALVAPLRAAGNPYPVSTPSLAWALERVQAGARALDGTVAAVREGRAALTQQLRLLGAEVQESQGNFVLARLRDPERLGDLLAGLGIAVRTFPGRADLADAVRITVPADALEQGRLARALDAALAPEALLFDLDGVLADVSRSYRAAILSTAAWFGAEVTDTDVARAKATGGANDDWELTWRLMRAAGVERELAEVTDRFERLYQGAEGSPGLRRTERLLLERSALERLAARARLGVVTGRPRADAERFLLERGIRDLFEVVVCREDAPQKPDPAPVRCALERLGAGAAWMIGDTPDDVRAARAAGVVPVGVVAPGEREPEAVAATLVRAGAARVLAATTELEGLLR